MPPSQHWHLRVRAAVANFGEIGIVRVEVRFPLSTVFGAAVGVGAAFLGVVSNSFDLATWCGVGNEG